jgi:3-dehydroquinate dehydratase
MENTLKLENTFINSNHPFTITFTHQHESISIALKDNADLFKLAESYKQLLDKLEIKCIVTYKNINDQN